MPQNGTKAASGYLGRAPIVEAERPRRAGQIHRLHFLEREAAFANELWNRPSDATAAGDLLPRRRHPFLPLAHAFVRRLTVLAEDQAPARLQYAPHTLQSAIDVRDGAQRVSDEHGIDGLVH